MFPIKPVGNVLIFRVQIVQNSVSVIWETCRENDDLVDLAQFF